ncbi:MAG: hypothetical protein QM441_05300 [Synergistota bacterium]|nr:hypothetical protein [Synergistota bacterium]
MRSWCKKLIIITTALLSLFIFPSFACGMAAPQHFQIWNTSFGISEIEDVVFQEFWSFLQNEVIDKEHPGGDLAFYNELKNNFPPFNWGVYGHRLLFHWGFNADVKKHIPLVRRVNDTVPEDQKADFYKRVTEEQARRNRKIIEKLERLLGISGLIPRAIATIAYDLHILADYSTTDVQALPDIGYIANDFVQLGIMRLPGGSEYRGLIEASFYIGETSKERALNALLTIAVYLPRIVSPVFQRTGIKHAVPSTPYEEHIVKEKIRAVYFKGGN